MLPDMLAERKIPVLCCRDVKLSLPPCVRNLGEVKNLGNSELQTGIPVRLE